MEESVALAYASQRLTDKNNQGINDLESMQIEMNFLKCDASVKCVPLELDKPLVYRA